MDCKKALKSETIAVTLYVAAISTTQQLEIQASDNDNDNEMPYCDQAEPGYGTCFDSQDYDDVTGLAPCKDGSQVYDYRDCPDREDN